VKSGGSLAEFAAAPRPRTCAVCRLPENVLTELNAGLLSGVEETTGGKWLRSEGHEITGRMVGYHRERGHHEDSGEGNRR